MALRQGEALGASTAGDGRECGDRFLRQVGKNMPETSPSPVKVPVAVLRLLLRSRDRLIQGPGFAHKEVLQLRRGRQPREALTPAVHRSNLTGRGAHTLAETAKGAGPQMPMGSVPSQVT